MATQYPAFPTYAYPLFGRTLTTAAGQSPSTGTAVTASFTDINGGTTLGNGGVTLPSGTPGVPYTIANFTANGVYVWAPVGYGIIGVGNGNGYALAPWTSAVFLAPASAPLQFAVAEQYSIPVNTVPT